jgi:hypothetical protein
MSEPIESISQGNYILHNIDAKKLYVQEPLFTANSGDAVYVGWRPDETVLWSGDIGYSGASAQLSETPFNFSKIGIEWYTNNGAQFPRYFETYTNGVNSAQSFSFGDVTMETNHFKGIYCDVTTDNILRIVQCMEKNMTNTSQAQTNQNYRIKKVIGINRKENA